MQRSSTRFISCFWKRPLMRRLPTNSKITSPQMAAYSSKKTPPKGSSMATGTMQHGREGVGNIRVDLSAPHQIMREDNMWNDPARLDTKWLRSRDPRRYRPDFGQTEPHSLRKQFMRSPDERTRDAMSRDWEVAVRIAANRRRQAFIAQQRLDLDLASMQAEQESNTTIKVDNQSAKDAKRDSQRNKKY